ncbi:hypothetical protein PUN28_002012 [Cardiocondyla obscurior]|uniref:Uncharacterized protein n=1 Tax=Cardiocondyla obscurior TaxID=286306 RepID=A0AAW2GSE9_9HYME
MLRLGSAIIQTITISDEGREDNQDNQREKTRQELDGGEHHTARNRWTNRSESSTRRLRISAFTNAQARGSHFRLSLTARLSVRHNTPVQRVHTNRQ